MRSIFVPVADRPECDVALRATFEIARRLSADVTGCHIRPAPTEPGDWDLADLWTMSSTGAWPVEDEAEQARQADAARALFVSSAARFAYAVADEPGSRDNPRAHWRTLTGPLPDLMASVGGASDLIVVSRPKETSGQKAWLIMVAALLDSLRPVLLLPQANASVTGRRVAVAWNRGRTETLAFYASLPLIDAAEEVVLLTVGAEKRRGPTAEEMLRYLAIRGVPARARHVDRPSAGAELVKAASAEGADLLVAGAYTRGRFRELLLGGVTEYLLTKTEFPVLMMHV